MARKVETVTIDAAGRDTGKVFVIREMPASQAEKWAMRALFAMSRSGVEIPDDIAKSGLAGLAKVGLKAIEGINFFEAEPLLDEMFACIKIMPNPAKPEVLRDLIEDDIEEVPTRLRLRKEVLALHIDFFTLAALSNQG